MKVLFLGAGASVAAGYPTAYGLIPAVMAEAKATPLVVERGYLNEWQSMKRSARKLGIDPLLLNSPNPEIPLSALDLLVQASQEAPLNHIYAVGRGEHVTARDLQKWRQPRVRAAARARHAMAGLLAHYFHWHSFNDAQAPASRAYLRPLLDKLEPGDVVVTLNWDTTAEMTLAERGRWSPVDGYRLPSSRVKVVRRGAKLSRHSRPSEIAVLKLHAGVGWKHDPFDIDDVYLSNAYLLQFLPYQRKGKALKFTETGHVEVEGLDNFLIIPSYLKQVPRGRSMMHVWSEAIHAIASASEFEVWGYGLPESDGEVRLMLSTLRGRLDSKAVKIAVHDPSGDARTRWRQLLGENAVIDGQRLGQP